MGKVVDPKPPQWERKEKLEGVSEDLVITLAVELLERITRSPAPTVVALAALRLVQKATILHYQLHTGTAATNETLRQAAELAAHYNINGVADDDKDA